MEEAKLEVEQSMDQTFSSMNDELRLKLQQKARFLFHKKIELSFRKKRQQERNPYQPLLNNFLAEHHFSP